MPKLYQLAKIVPEVPATQVRVKRKFPDLKGILLLQRSNITNQMSQDVILGFSNKLFIKKMMFILQHKNTRKIHVKLKLKNK